MKNIAMAFGLMLIVFGMGIMVGSISTAKKYNTVAIEKLVADEKKSYDLFPDKKPVIIQGIAFIDYGGPTPLDNFCPNCKHYCLGKHCGNCGAKQKKYYYEAYCPKCNASQTGAQEYCTTCGTHIEYRKVKRD